MFVGAFVDGGDNGTDEDDRWCDMMGYENRGGDGGDRGVMVRDVKGL